MQKAWQQEHVHHVHIILAFSFLMGVANEQCKSLHAKFESTNFIKYNHYPVFLLLAVLYDIGEWKVNIFWL